MRSEESFSEDFAQADPRILWALLADTNRSARAMSLVPGKFHMERDAAGRPFQIGVARQLGMGVSWVSGPDSWVEGSWYHAVRRYLSGPAKDSAIDYRLAPLGSTADGCRVAISRFTTGSLPAYVYDRFLGGPALHRYLRESAALAVKARAKGIAWGQFSPAAAALAELLEGAPAGVLTGPARAVNEAELHLRLHALREAKVSQPIVDQLVETLRTWPDEEVAYLSPLHLADRWQQPRREVLRTFLHATHAGLLELHWNLRCQICRVPAAEVTTLAELPDQAHCPGCGGAFGPDLANHIEAAFSVHRALRPAKLHTFCTAGAALRPHVFAQLVATPEASCNVRAPLLDGELLLRVMGQPETRVLVPPHPGKLEITVRAGGTTVEAGPPGDGTTEMSVRSELVGTPAVVLLERMGWSDEWVSGAALTAVPEFHELFPGEAPRSRHEVSVGGITVLFTDLRGSTAMYQKLGDARAYTVVDDHFERLAQVIEGNDGALIKTMGDAVMAVFQTVPAAVRAALAMQRALAVSESSAVGLALKLGIHSGTCLAVRANGRLDFFGNAVNLAARAQGQSQGGDIVVTDAIIEHPEVAALLEGVSREPFEATLKGIAEPVRLWRLRPDAAQGGVARSAGS